MLITGVWHSGRAELLWTGRKEGKLTNSAGATNFAHDRFIFIDIYGFPFLEQHQVAQIQHVRSVAQNDRQQPSLSSCRATSRRRPMSSNLLITAATYMFCTATGSDIIIHSTQVSITYMLRCHLTRLLQRPPLPPRPVSSKYPESVNRVITATSYTLS